MDTLSFKGVGPPVRDQLQLSEGFVSALLTPGDTLPRFGYLWHLYSALPLGHWSQSAWKLWSPMQQIITNAWPVQGDKSPALRLQTGQAQRHNLHARLPRIRQVVLPWGCTFSPCLASSPACPAALTHPSASWERFPNKSCSRVSSLLGSPT